MYFAAEYRTIVSCTESCNQNQARQSRRKQTNFIREILQQAFYLYLESLGGSKVGAFIHLLALPDAMI